MKFRRQGEGREGKERAYTCNFITAYDVLKMMYSSVLSSRYSVTSYI